MLLYLIGSAHICPFRPLLRTHRLNLVLNQSLNQSLERKITPLPFYILLRSITIHILRNGKGFGYIPLSHEGGKSPNIIKVLTKVSRR